MARCGNLSQGLSVHRWFHAVMRDAPLFIRLCAGFVDNLGLILRVALVCGAVVFVQELGEIRERFAPAEDDTAPAQSAAEEPAEPPAPAANDDEPWLSDGVRHALNCTHAEYRNRHYEACVQEPSDVYRRPAAETDDDIGFIPYGDAVLYAQLNPAPD